MVPVLGHVQLGGIHNKENRKKKKKEQNYSRLREGYEK